MNSKIPGTSISQEIPRDLEAHIFLTLIIKTQPSGLTLHPHPFQSQLKKGPKPFYFIGHLAFTKYSISSVGPIQPHRTPPHTHFPLYALAQHPAQLTESNSTQQA